MDPFIGELWPCWVQPRAVARYLDCGVWDNGFARVRCRKCPQEFLVAFSCKGRGLCPSCGAKRAVELAAFLADEVVEDVGHAQWVFTLPEMLRVYFLYHRELLGGYCQLEHMGDRVGRWTAA